MALKVRSLKFSTMWCRESSQPMVSPGKPFTLLPKVKPSIIKTYQPFAPCVVKSTGLEDLRIIYFVRL